MPDNKATNPFAVQLATIMDAEASSLNSIPKKKRGNKPKKNRTNLAKPVSIPTSVAFLHVKTCTNSVIMEKMSVPSLPNNSE